MKRLYFLLSLFLIVPAVSLKAVVAKPGPIEVIQSDGSVRTMYLHGDEYLHYFSDASGASFRWSDGKLKPFTLTHEMVSNALERREQFFSGLRPIVAPAGARTKGQAKHQKVLVLLVSFSDLDFTVENPNGAFNNLCNQEGYSYNGATGSVRDYFMDNSMGQYVPEFEVKGPYKLPNKLEFYCDNDESTGFDKNPHKMVVDGLSAAYADGVDLSAFDTDGNGEVDYIFVYCAGYDEAEGAGSKYLWPHSSYVDYTVGGVYFSRYACSSELTGARGATMAGIGAFCHEFAHALGLSDLYDTDYEESGGKGDGVGRFSLMASGNYNNDSKTPPYLIAEERETLGWLRTQDLSEGSVTLKDISENEAYRLDAENKGEYFLFENRKKIGWDAYIPSNGLIIYQVDKSGMVVYGGMTAAEMWMWNIANAYPQHECMKIIRADGKNLYGAGFPGSSGTYTEFTYNSKPAAVSWTGLPLPLELTGISLDNNGQISFTVRQTQAGNVLKGKVSDKDGASLQDAQLTLVNEDNGKVQVAVSDGNGLFDFTKTVVSGHYVLRCQKEGYYSQERRFEMKGQPVGMNFVMYQIGGSVLTATWAGLMENSLTSSTKFRAGAAWASEDIQLSGNLLVASASLYIYEGTPEVKVVVYVDDKPVGEKTFGSKKITESAYNTFDLSDLKIAYRNTQSLLVAFDIGGASSIVTDGGPEVVGKGGLVASYGQTNWEDIVDSGFDFNWMIAVDFSEDKDVVAVDSLTITPSSLTIRTGDEYTLLATAHPSDAAYSLAEWSSSNSAVVKVDAYGHLKAVAQGTAKITATADRGRVKKECAVTVLPSLQEGLETMHGQQMLYAKWPEIGTGWKVKLTTISGGAMMTETTDVPQLTITGLTPGATYRGTVEAYDAEQKLLASATFDFTMDAVLKRPMCIGYDASKFKQRGMMLLEVLNLKDGSTVTWKYDGKEVGDLVLPYSDGEHLLQAEIKLPGSQGTEIIRRKLVMSGTKGLVEIEEEAKEPVSVQFTCKILY